MHKNLLWQAFIIVMLLTTLWYTIGAVYDYNRYAHLTSQIRPTSIDWRIEEKNTAEFVLNAHYQFTFNKQTFTGITAFENNPFRNLWAAQQAALDWSKQAWPVWFDPHNPLHSDLQKEFPFKKMLSALFLWVLLLYFLGLGYYVAKFKS